MKVILYMAMTANSFIAKPDDNTDWISAEEWASYSAMVQKAGAMIIGHKTYDLLTKQDGFEELKDVKIVVVSGNEFETIAPHHLIAKSPKAALELLKDFDQVIVAGGAILNASFIKEKLIDEIYLDIEPWIIGKGIPVFDPDDFECKLELLETRNITKDSFQLHYKVKNES